MLKIKLPRPFALKLFLAVVLLEIFLGGGGRLVNVGALSIRMYFFIFCLIVGFLLLMYRQAINRNYLILLFVFTLVTAFSALIGFLNGASAGMIFNDIKPLLSFYSLIFFAAIISSIEDVKLIARLIKVSAIALALGYLLLFALINIKLIPFNPLYRALSETNEFFFRGDFAFFYKGFLYICIGLTFYYVRDGKANRMIILVLVAALVLTFTRGFLLSIVLVYLFYVTVIQGKGVKLVLALLVLAGTLYFSWEFVNNAKKIDRTVSNNERITQIIEVGEAISLPTVFFGHGFGIGIPSREDRMEIAYLEIFHKQGLLGLSFWVILFFAIWKLYVRARSHHFTMATQFFLATVLVYVQSFTNPYVNNPIGLTMVLLSTVCLTVLGKVQTSDNP